MQNIRENYEINLADLNDSNSLADSVVGALDLPGGKNSSVKLILGSNQINQSQMVFIKSLIESYNSKLRCVETTNDTTRDICIEMGINTSDIPQDSDIQNEKLDELREQFKAGFENSNEINDADVTDEKSTLQSQIEENSFEDKSKAVEVIKNDANEATKQIIGVYRKADEKENEIEFQDEEVDFYATPTDESVVVDTKDTIYINQTLRNGQTVDYDGNVVIIGDCHPGSEIKATGDITVWGVLGSIAHAGAKGNVDARIRALKMNAVQLRIANCYSRRPDGGNIPYFIKSAVFTPEEARIVDDNIVLFKMAQN